MNVPSIPSWSPKIEGWLIFTDHMKMVNNAPTVPVNKRAFFWSFESNASTDAETKEAKYLFSIDKVQSSWRRPNG